MEFNARYTLIGVFTLALCVAIFMFVYWLNNTGGFGKQVEYRVRFSVPVSGLAEGGNVLFNGLKVGEISRLYIDPAEPAKLVAVVTVSETVPVRADTVAGISYQGLTGAANILFTGGTSDAPPLSSKEGLAPLIEADPAASRSWTDNASRVLQRIDEIFGDNKNRLNSILDGLERMTGGGQGGENKRIYDLYVPTEIQIPASAVSWKLTVSEPTILLSLNTDKVLKQLPDGAWQPFENVRWSDNLPNLVQSKVIQAYENAGLTDAVLRPADALESDFSLVIDIRTFHLILGDSPSGLIDFIAKIIGQDGTVVATRRLRYEVEALSDEETNAVKALQAAFETTITDLVSWSVEVLAS